MNIQDDIVSTPLINNLAYSVEPLSEWVWNVVLAENESALRYAV